MSLVPLITMGRLPEDGEDDGLWSNVAQSLLGAGTQLRYGMSPEEMHLAVIEGRAPGATPNPPEDEYPEEKRRASAYYFGKRFPSIAEPAVRATNAVRSFAPGINPFADDPESSERLHEIALNAVMQGIRDAE